MMCKEDESKMAQRVDMEAKSLNYLRTESGK